MKIKRFFAPEMRQAIQLVRAEQGPDAVILSTRSTQGGVEIVAAVDYDAELIDSMAGSERASVQASSAKASAENTGEHAAPEALEPEEPQPTPAQRPRPAAARPAPAAIEWAQDPTLCAMREELRALRGLLQDEVARIAKAEREQSNPVFAATVRRLAGLGFDEELARQVTRAARPDGDPARAWRETLVALADAVPIPAADPLERGGIIALVGATGVGKTTTAAKLAARCAIRYGKSSVALISTDDYRVGAQRQLASFGMLLGVPVRQARSAAELAAHISDFGERRVVIIDTAGMSQRDAGLIGATRDLIGIADVRSYLVMSANLQREVMDEVAAAFHEHGPAGCILTKVDEAARLGPAISAVVRHRLPIAFLSEGQRVPEDLKIARTQELVARAITQPNRGPQAGHIAAQTQTEVEYVQA